ncbi:hypothetical protein [Sulfitobacter sp. MF3-043]|uniref:hypothetical protein n=1 Tax=Sulfitobacter sediminivivens TaxID=3252902 RepID=UPI0036DBD88F
MKPFFIATFLTATTTLPGIAGGTLDMSSVASGQTSNTYFPIDDGHMIVFTSTEYTSNNQDDAGTLLSGMKGECSGTLELQPPAASGQGHCVFRTAMGAIIYTKWVATGMTAEGAITGEWTTVGGTDVFAGATGGGTFVSLTDQATGKTENAISGSTELQ